MAREEHGFVREHGFVTISDSGGRAAGRESLSSRQPAWASLSGNPSVKALENTLLANHEVVCDVTVKTTTPPGGHVLLVIGFDRNRKVFFAKNHWGEDKFKRLAKS